MKREAALPPPPEDPPFPAAAADPNLNDSFREEAVLMEAAALTREELIRRRCRRAKRLNSLYMDEYWALMEEIRAKHREYYWNHGISPLEEEDGGSVIDCVEAMGSPKADNEEGVGENGVAARSRCSFPACRLNAMPLTKYCHSHILSDRRQVLYKGCSYVVKSGQNGSIICGKPVSSGGAVPSLCPVHFQKAQKHMSQALKKAGHNVSSSSKPAPKLHVLIAEYVQNIQTKRREASETSVENIEGFDRNQLGFQP